MDISLIRIKAEWSDIFIELMQKGSPRFLIEEVEREKKRQVLT